MSDDPLPEWLDGPMFHDWILKKAPHIIGDREGILGYTHSRSMMRWRTGERCHYSTADRLLTQLGLHLTEIPDEVWRWARHDEKERGMAHFRNGKSVKQVAAWFKIKNSTATKWKIEADRHKKDAA